MVRKPQRKRQDRQRGILASAGDERAAIHYEQIPDVVALVVLVEHGCLRVATHAARAQLVNALAGRDHLVVPGQDLESRAMA